MFSIYLGLFDNLISKVFKMINISPIFSQSTVKYVLKVLIVFNEITELNDNKSAILFYLLQGFSGKKVALHFTVKWAI